MSKTIIDTNQFALGGGENSKLLQHSNSWKISYIFFHNLKLYP